jgi:LCCL domain
MFAAPRIGRLGRRTFIAIFLGTLSWACWAGLPLCAARSQVNKPAEVTSGPPPAVEVRFVDDSVMKLLVLEDKLDVHTRYGRLRVPLCAVRKIEFGTRLSADVAARIEAAIADLGHTDFKRRKAASNELQSLGEKAYPAVLKAAKSSDMEVARRAEQLLAQFRENIPEERLKVRDQDAIYTDDSKFCGRIQNITLRVKTFQFGEQQLKLADLRSLGVKTAEPEVNPANAMPDPGTLAGLQNQVGKTFAIRVIGALPGGGGGVWGTDIYTLDSTLAIAAVHAGLLRPGQTGIVHVTILGPVPGFQGSTRNGITSSGYGLYAGYRVNR